MANLLSWAGKKLKGGYQTVERDVVNPVVHQAQGAVAQLNPLDSARTYSTVMNQGADFAPKADQSGAYQLTHNGLTNVAGNAVIKPAFRLGQAVNQGIGNAELAIAGRPTKSAQEFFGGTPSLNRFSGYTGTARQIAGDTITTAANVVAPGSSKALELGVGKVLPAVTPKIIPRVLSTAVVGAPVGAVSNEGAYISSGQPLTRQGLLESAKQGAEYGAAGGAILPVAGAVGSKGARYAIKGTEAAVNKVVRAQKDAVLQAATARAGIQNAPVGKLTPTDISGYGELSRPRVEYYKNEIQAGRKPAAIMVVRAGGKNFVEDGKHRLQAYKELGYSKAPVKVTTPQGLKLAAQGGYVGGVPEDLGGANNLLPNAEQNVFGQNPSLPENQPVLKGKDAGVEPPKLPEFNTKRVSNLDKTFRSTRSIIERQGESGKQLAGLLQNQRDTKEVYLAQLQKAMPTVRKLKGKAFQDFVDATQGIKPPPNETIAKAVQEWQAVHPGIRERAVNAGLDVGDLGQTYYPHFIDYEKVFKDKNMYNAAINHLVQTGQAQTPEDAIKLLGYARDVSRNREFGNLEASRLVDLPFYDKTPNSLISYLNGSAKRISQVETFGKGDEKALELLKRVGLEGGDTEAAKNAFDVAVGAKRYSPTAERVSGNIRKYITTTRLGLGALTNASQNVNTGIVTGHMRTLSAAIKQLSPKTRGFVEDTGVIADAVLNDLRTQSGFASFGKRAAGKVMDKITAPFFGTVEKLNRSIAATAGRDYGLRLAQLGDEKTLRKLGVTGAIENRTLSPAQQIQVARKVVEKTQFKVDPQDLPGWVDSPGGKLVAQFRTFSYAQGKFVSNEILKPAAQGNFKPLARLLAALPVGYGLYETKRAIAGRPEEENKAKIGLQAFQNVGGAGLVFDLYQSLNPIGSKYLPPDRRTSMAVGAFGGPAAGVGAQGVGAVSEAIQRKNTPKDEARLKGKVVAGKNKNDYTDLTALSRFGLQQVPIVGTPIKNRLLPFTTESNADAGKPTTPSNAKADAAAKRAEADYKKSIANGLDKGSAETIKLVSSLSPADREKAFEKKNDAEYQYNQAKYNKDVKSGKLNAAQKIRAQRQLAKDKIGSVYPKNVRDLYSLSKTDLNAYLTTPEKGVDKKKIADQLVAYDKSLSEAGLVTTRKFKTGIAPKRSGTKGGSKRGGSGVTASEALSVAKTASGIKTPTLSVAKPRPVAKQSKKVALKRYQPTKSTVSKATVKRVS